MDGACSTHWRNEKCVLKLWPENLKGRDDSKDLSVDGKIITKRFLGEVGRKVWSRCIWFRVGPNGGPSWTR
jgi:hypothetical protein